MVKRKKRTRTRLPPAATGLELSDLKWASLTPWAEELMSLVHPDPLWATWEGASELVRTRWQRKLARRELEASRAGRLMTRVRQRQVDVLDRRFEKQVLLICSALAAQARAEWPKAEFAQLWLVVRDRLWPLLKEACEIEMWLSELE